MNITGNDVHDNKAEVPVAPVINGKHSETNGITQKTLTNDLVNFDMGLGQGEPQGQVADSKYEFDPLTPDLVSPPSGSGIQFPAKSQDSKLIDLEQIADTDDIHDASTASVTPASPPHDATLDVFDPLQPEGQSELSNQNAAAGQEDLTEKPMTVFGKTGQTLEELGVFEAPPPPTDTTSNDLVSFSEGPLTENGVPAPQPLNSNNPFAADLASLSSGQSSAASSVVAEKVEKVEASTVQSAAPSLDTAAPPDVPKEAFASPLPGVSGLDKPKKKATPPASPTKKIQCESKLPKKGTPPGSPKKQLPGGQQEEAKKGTETKLFQKVAPPSLPSKKAKESTNEARPKTVPSKQAPPPAKASPRDKKTEKPKETPQKSAEDARPQTAPSKIPSPKKERKTQAPTPKKGER